MAVKPSVFSNPIIYQLSKVKDTVAADGCCATYGGVAFKTAFYLLLTGVGMGVYLLNPFNLQNDTLSILIISIVTALSPILCWFIKSLTPVFGALYSFGQGIVVTWTSVMFAKEYKGIIIAAIAITLILILSMLILYTTGIIKVGHKFKAVLFTLFACSLLSSIGIFISALIFPGNAIVQLLLSSNGIFSIVLAAIGVIIATLFLLVDFDSINQMVVSKLPKKYEWTAAFGLIITVLWLYLKILSLLARTSDSSD